MTDQQFNILSISGIVLILWWLFRERSVNAVTVAPSESPALPVSWETPMSSAYGDDASTSPFAPATPQQLAINIANQSAAMLNQNYIPLFGFVGMAQGELYQ